MTSQEASPIGMKGLFDEINRQNTLSQQRSVSNPYDSPSYRHVRKLILSAKQEDTFLEELTALEREGLAQEILDKLLSEFIGRGPVSTIETKEKYNKPYVSPDEIKAKRQARNAKNQAKFEEDRHIEMRSRYYSISSTPYNIHTVCHSPELVYPKLQGDSGSRAINTRYQINTLPSLPSDTRGQELGDNKMTHHQNNLRGLHLYRYHGHIYVRGVRQEHRAEKRKNKNSQ